MIRLLLQVFCLVFLCSVVHGKSGSCPPTLSVDICEAACGPRSQTCPSSQLCCPTSCGGSMCVDPVTARHFVNFVKSGKCPSIPRGAWVCTDSCTGDYDCPKSLKCCTNRCGALSCQRPELD